MLISFPQMGHVDVFLGDLFDRLQIDYMVPPKSSERTLALGSKFAPEFACLPLKINIGNFIEALENGADTLIMAGGRGPCRFGYYAEVEKRIIKEAGYDFEMVIVEPPSMGISKFLGPIRRASGKSSRKIIRALKESFPKAQAFDKLERHLLKMRGYEVEPGGTTKAYKQAMKVLQNISSPEEVDQYLEEATAVIDAVEKDPDRDVLRIGIIGEFFILLEPFVNFDIEEWLGSRGVCIDRAIYITDWIGPTSANPVAGVSSAEIVELAKPYLNHTVGGDGLLSVGHTVHYARDRFDGVIHLFPFTCMPETIAKSVLPRVSRDLDIPIIHFTIDEQTGRAGMVTRLEAFMDLLKSRKRRAARVGQNIEVK